MADWEARALRRDKGFLFKLFGLLALGVVVGIWLFGHLTSESIGAWAAGIFGTVTEGSP